MKKITKTFRLDLFTIEEIEDIKSCYQEYEWTNTDIVEMAIANMHTQLIKQKGLLPERKINAYNRTRYTTND